MELSLKVYQLPKLTQLKKRINYFYTKLLLQLFLDKKFNSLNIPLIILWFFHCKCSVLQNDNRA